MFKLVICDDDSIFLKTLQKAIENHLTSKNIPFKIKTFYSSEMFLEDLSENFKKYDLFVVDISIPKVGGVDLVTWVHKRRSDAYIIMLSAYKQFVFDAFEWNVFRSVSKSNWQQRHFAATDIINEKTSKAIGYYVYHSVDGSQKIYYNEFLYLSKSRKIPFSPQLYKQIILYVLPCVNFIPSLIQVYSFMQTAAISSISIILSRYIEAITRSLCAITKNCLLAERILNYSLYRLNKNGLRGWDNAAYPCTNV